MRIQVKRFAEEMEKVLARHDNHKSGYQACTYHYLFGRLLDEVRELHAAIYEDDNNADIVNECVDIANFAMMIADKHLKKEVSDERV